MGLFTKPLLNFFLFPAEYFVQQNRSQNDFKNIIKLIKKYNVINDCYSKAEYFINLSSNSLSIFPECKEKEILKKLTSFSLERSF